MALVAVLELTLNLGLTWDAYAAGNARVILGFLRLATDIRLEEVRAGRRPLPLLGPPVARTDVSLREDIITRWK